jgi:hypothetical protein
MSSVLNPDNITTHIESSPPLRFSTSSIIEIAVGAAVLVCLIAGTIVCVLRRRKRQRSAASSPALPAVERPISTTEVPLKMVDDDWSSRTKTIEREELESPNNDYNVRELDWKAEHRKTEVAQLDANREPVEMLADVPSRHVFEKGHDMG